MYGPLKGIGGGGVAALGATSAHAHHALGVWLPVTGLNVVELVIAGFVLLAAGQAIMRMLPKLERRR